ncbi:MAG: hypothetical protein ABSH56_33525 [Bryobacteraceae bacterium]|jgi:hypothetical protein
MPLADLLYRLRAIFREAVERELDGELRFHANETVGNLMRSGTPSNPPARRCKWRPSPPCRLRPHPERSS